MSYHLPVHRSVGVMGAQAGNRGENDRGHGSAQGKVEDAVRWEMLRVEDESQYRHQDQPAANTQQSGKIPDNRTQQQISRRPLHLRFYDDGWLASISGMAETSGSVQVPNLGQAWQNAWTGLIEYPG